jgi:hypothetical protein
MMLVSIGKAKDVSKDRLFEKPFNFYSNYIKLSSDQKESIMEQEIVECYKSLTVDLEDRLELKENENKANRMLIDNFITVESDLNKKIEHLNYRIERMNEMH